MRPANDPEVDYKVLVQRGYDRCAAEYTANRQAEAGPELNLLLSHLEPGANVLEIGCGAGIPVARTLAQKYHVTGVDISGEQIRRARVNVPTGCFLQSDIMTVAFPPTSFDVVVAFYVIFHLPQEEHFGLFERIACWLKPGGYLLATLSIYAEAAYIEDDFYGVSMYWSNCGLEDYQTMLTKTGFELLETRLIGPGYAARDESMSEQHPLVFARRLHTSTCLQHYGIL